LLGHGDKVNTSHLVEFTTFVTIVGTNSLIQVFL